MPDAEAVAFLRGAAREMLVIEVAGLFWLWAELLILFAVVQARRRLDHAAPRPLARQLLLLHFPFVLLTAAILVRHYASPLWDPAQPGDWPALYTSTVRNHLMIWCLFVLGWVVLESAIVWQGVRVYGRVTGLCRRVMAAACLVAIALLCETSQAQQVALAELQSTDAALQPIRNGVYLYLRAAGVVWIAVEWVAAVLLWRGQSQLRNAADRLESARHA